MLTFSKWATLTVQTVHQHHNVFSTLTHLSRHGMFVCHLVPLLAPWSFCPHVSVYFLMWTNLKFVSFMAPICFCLAKIYYLIPIDWIFFSFCYHQRLFLTYLYFFSFAKRYHRRKRLSTYARIFFVTFCNLLYQFSVSSSFSAHH